MTETIEQIADKISTEAADAVVEYLNATPQPTDANTLGRCLVVADRGFVWTAAAARIDDDWAYLTGAQAVRRWGTSQGLNELAQKGPLPNTRLDAKTDLQVSRRAIIAVIPSEADTWPG